MEHTKPSSLLEDLQQIQALLRAQQPDRVRTLVESLCQDVADQCRQEASQGRQTLWLSYDFDDCRQRAGALLHADQAAVKDALKQELPRRYPGLCWEVSDYEWITIETEWKFL